MRIPDDLHVNPTDEEWLRLSEAIELEDGNGDCLPYRFMDRGAVNALLNERIAALDGGMKEGERAAAGGAGRQVTEQAELREWAECWKLLKAELEFDGRDAEYVADMANIGHEYMKAVAGKDYAQSPVEVYRGLVDEVEELRAIDEIFKGIPAPTLAAPEPEVPEEIKDLVHVGAKGLDLETDWNAAILEAYRRGQKTAPKLEGTQFAGSDAAVDRNGGLK